MNKIKTVCESCGVEWVNDDAMPDAPDIKVHRIPNCESCCPQAEAVKDGEHEF